MLRAEPYVGVRRKVKDHPAAIERILKSRCVLKVPLHEAEAAVGGRGLQVLPITGREVIEDGHLPALLNEPLHYMTANEPGASGHEHSLRHVAAIGVPKTRDRCAADAQRTRSPDRQ